MADEIRQNRSLAKDAFSVYTTHWSVIIISLLDNFILHLEFKLLDGFVYPTGSYSKEGI